MTIALAVVVGCAVLFAYALGTAQRWTKVDQEEIRHSVQVPDGTWHVTAEAKDICYVGQDYWDCIDEYTSEYNFACAERIHDDSSRAYCDQYYDTIQEMRTDAADDYYGSTVSGLTGGGMLTIRENTKHQWVIDQPKQSHEAICYLGFIGECPQEPDSTNQSSNKT